MLILFQHVHNGTERNQRQHFQSRLTKYKEYNNRDTFVSK